MSKPQHMWWVETKEKAQGNNQCGGNMCACSYSGIAIFFTPFVRTP